MQEFLVIVPGPAGREYRVVERDEADRRFDCDDAALALLTALNYAGKRGYEFESAHGAMIIMPRYAKDEE